MQESITPWQVIKSTITYEDRWIRLRSDTCRAQQDRIITPYHVLEFPDWVNVVALTANKEIVLAREYRHGAGEIVLGLPGGIVENSDTDTLATIQRELREETGYTGKTFLPIGQCYANPANQNNRIHSFLALDVVQTHTQELDEAEQIEIVLQDFLTFNQQAWNGTIPLQALHLSTLGLAEHFIRQSNHPGLQDLRAALRQS
jgi:NTP pyrophosphohydrolases including oxidative damage repair enzymes